MNIAQLRAMLDSPDVSGEVKDSILRTLQQPAPPSPAPLPYPRPVKLGESTAQVAAGQPRRRSAGVKADLEALFSAMWARAGGPELRPQFGFDPGRGWRFDFALPSRFFAVEIEGLVGGGKGRHQTVAGAQEDCEKYLEAALAGWTLIRLTKKQITAAFIERIVRHAATLTSYGECLAAVRAATNGGSLKK